MYLGKTGWQIELKQCEVFVGDDASAPDAQQKAALKLLPGMISQLMANPEAGLSVAGDSTRLLLSSRKYDEVDGSKVVAGLTLIYEVQPAQRRVVLHGLRLLPTVHAEAHRIAVGVVESSNAYSEVSRRGVKVIYEHDTRGDDCETCTVQARPRFFQVFRGLNVA